MTHKEKQPLHRTIDIAKQEYGLTGRIKAVDLSQGGYYGGVIKLTDDQDSYALKRYSQDSVDLLKFTIKVFGHLQQSGFSNFSQFMPTIDGNFYFNYPEGGYGVLYKWIEGSSLSNDSTEEDVRAKITSISTVTALFHQATANFPRDHDSIIDDNISGMWGTELVERHDTVSTLINAGDDNVLYQMGLDNKTRLLLTSSTPIVNALKDTDQLRQLEQLLTWGVVHHDLWIGHVIFDNKNNSFLIDFDRLRIGRIADDVERVIAESLRFGKSYGKIALATYLEKNPLPEAEIKLLPFLIKYGVVRRTFWLINRFITDGINVQRGPLNLSDEIDYATEIMDTDLEQILF